VAAAIVLVVDLVRFGVVIRALRRRRGWRQADLAAAAGVSQDVISLIERGLGGRMPVETLARVAAALEARLKLDILWRAGELDRLLDEGHALLTAELTRRLTSFDWTVQIEVTYDVYGSKGSIDVFAWHGPTSSLLVVEIKTEVTAGEATLRKLDEKARLGRRIAIERFGWRPETVSRLLVVEATATARRRVARGAGLFDAALPLRGTAARRWLRRPSDSVAGLLFLAPTTPDRHIQRRGGRHRVRPARGASNTVPLNVIDRDAGRASLTRGCSVLTNRRYDDPGS